MRESLWSRKRAASRTYIRLSSRSGVPGGVSVRRAPLRLPSSYAAQAALDRILKASAATETRPSRALTPVSARRSGVAPRWGAIGGLWSEDLGSGIM